MEKKSIRSRALAKLDLTLILFDLVLSVTFILLGHFISNNYIRGVGIGLLIAGATSAIAHLYKKKKVTL